MLKIKTILIVLITTMVLCMAALTILIATLNDNHYRWIVIRAAKYFAGLEITVEGPFSVKLSSEPSITASKIRINDISSPDTAKIDQLEVKFALLPLISGTVLIRHLLIHDATVLIINHAEKPFNIILPIFENIALNNVQLTISDDNKREAVCLLLGKFSLDNVEDKGHLHIKGEGTLNAKEFVIDGRLGSLTDILKNDKPYPLDLRLDMAGVHLTMSGIIDDLAHNKGLNVHVIAKTGEVTNLLHIFNADFPNFDQLSLDAKIVGDVSSPGLADIQLSVSNASDFNLTVKGSIENMLTGKGTSLQVSGSCTSKNILKMLLSEEIPEIHNLKGEGHIRDENDVYVIDALKLNVSNKQGVTIKAEGIMSFSRAIGKMPAFKELDIHCHLLSPTTTWHLFPAVDSLPETGAVSAKARVRFSGKALSIEDISITTGESGQVRTKWQGRIGSIPLSGSKFPSDIDMLVSIDADEISDLTPLSAISLPNLGPLKTTLHIVEQKGIYRFKDIQVSIGSQKSLWIEGTGSVDMAIKDGSAYLYGIDAEVKASAPKTSDTLSFQSFMGIKLPRFGAPMIEGKIKGNMTKSSFEGTIRFGSSQFNTTVNHTHTRTKQRPSVMIKIVAPVVHLTDLGFYTKRAENLPSKSKPEPKPDRRLFSDTPFSFHALKAIDLSAFVDIDKLKGKDFVLNKLDLDISLKDGKLRVAPAKIIYKNGFASIDFTLDAVSSKPQMALKLTAEDVNIGALLPHISKTPFLQGQLNLVVDLQSAGNSFREIVTALGGEIGLAIEKGKIKKTIEIMGADAVSLLQTIRSKAEYTDLNCMALRFIFEDGIGKSKIIYIDTPDISIKGNADINLHTETMNMILQPDDKKRLGGDTMTSAVTINGSIADPKVRKLPFKEAAILYGEIFIPVVFLPARALGHLWHLISKDKEEDCPCLIMGIGAE